MIQFKLPGGETDFLITNIFDMDFIVDNFKELYHMRLCIETEYNDIKNKLELENFFGCNSACHSAGFFCNYVFAQFSFFHDY